MEPRQKADRRVVQKGLNMRFGWARVSSRTLDYRPFQPGLPDRCLPPVCRDADAARRCLRAAEVGGVVLIVNAKNDRAARWYASYDALLLSSRPLTLVMSLATFAASWRRQGSYKRRGAESRRRYLCCGIGRKRLLEQVLVVDQLEILDLRTDGIWERLSLPTSRHFDTSRLINSSYDCSIRMH
jgi:hypothetical protein